MKKTAAFASVMLLLAFAGSAFAISNAWWSKQGVTQVFVIDSDVGSICQFALTDGSTWAFKVATREKTVDLVQVALTSAKFIQVNYASSGSSALNDPPKDFLQFTPKNGAHQTVPLAYGASLAK
jgi:hypothetical protein